MGSSHSSTRGPWADGWDLKGASGELGMITVKKIYGDNDEHSMKIYGDLWKLDDISELPEHLR